MTSIDENRYALHPEIFVNTEVVMTTVEVKPYSYLQEKYSLKHIDLIKIDVEGHELAILRSLYSEIEASHPTMIIEIIGEESANQINALLNPLKYKYLAIDEINETLTLVPKLWDNDHQNFLVCTQEVLSYLQSVELL